MCIYITDYGKSFKNKLWYLHHRPGDSKELLCSGKSTPVCQLEVFKKLLSYNEVMKNEMKPQDK